MRDFKECRIATSPAEAVSMLKAGPGKGCYMAGGTTLNNSCADCDFLVDINQAGLGGIDGSAEGDVLIGAATPLQECYDSRVLNDFAGGAISQVAGQYGNRLVRTAATIGGNLCQALPSADMAPVLMALGAVCIIIDEDSQETVPLEDFFVAPRQTVLDNRLLAGLVLPQGLSGWRCQSYKLTRSAEGVALVQVAVALEVIEGVINQARIALGGVAPVPLRSQLAEKLLVGLKVDEIIPALVEDVALIASSECDPADDDLASAEYRTDMVRVITRRLICRVLAEEGLEDCQAVDPLDGNEGGAA